MTYDKRNYVFLDILCSNGFVAGVGRVEGAEEKSVKSNDEVSTSRKCDAKQASGQGESGQFPGRQHVIASAKDVIDTGAERQSRHDGRRVFLVLELPSELHHFGRFHANNTGR